MTLGDIEYYVQLAQTAGLSEIEYQAGGSVLRVKAAAPSAAASPSAPEKPTQAVEARKIRTRSMGRFLHSHPMSSTGAQDWPRAVDEGETVGFLQVGTRLTPVLADEAGILIPTKASGELAGYGDAVFEYRSRS